jgi:alpha-mannosidase
MHLVSLTDKKTGEQLIDKPSCYFRYADENPIYGMISWRVGPLMKVVDLNSEHNVRFGNYNVNNVMSTVSYVLKFGMSEILCRIVLKANSSVLEFDTKIDWLEEAKEGERIPQITFALPVSYKTTGKCTCDIPFGVIERNALAHDVPCLSFLAVNGESESTVALMTDTKYGYRFWEDTATVTLIRSAYQPDLYPDRGIHNIHIGVAVGDIKDVKEKSSAFNHPLAFIPATAHDGDLPTSGSFLTVDGDVVVSCLKNSEDGKGNTVRLYDESGKDREVTLTFCKPVSAAYLTDSNENILSELTIKDGAVTVPVSAFDVVTVVAHF